MYIERETERHSEEHIPIVGLGVNPLTMCVCVYIYIYIHTYIHTHIRIHLAYPYTRFNAPPLHRRRRLIRGLTRMYRER